MIFPRPSHLPPILAALSLASCGAFRTNPKALQKTPGVDSSSDTSVLENSRSPDGKMEIVRIHHSTLPPYNGCWLRETHGGNLLGKLQSEGEDGHRFDGMAQCEWQPSGKGLVVVWVWQRETEIAIYGKRKDGTFAKTESPQGGWPDIQKLRGIEQRTKWGITWRLGQWSKDGRSLPISATQDGVKGETRIDASLHAILRYDGHHFRITDVK